MLITFTYDKTFKQSKKTLTKLKHALDFWRPRFAVIFLCYIQHCMMVCFKTNCGILKYLYTCLFFPIGFEWNDHIVFWIDVLTQGVALHNIYICIILDVFCVSLLYTPQSYKHRYNIIVLLSTVTWLKD